LVAGDLLANAELRERGLARVRDVYAWPKIARQYLGFFTELRGTTGIREAETNVVARKN
jgi:hypothetical protein